ncbi:hypothetical protein [Agromyces ramosus]|uniref:Bacitracin resistance protein n=1 Tax=Agromyces ramosus TaxID=33879 RepID=A0ABU0R3R7_9MICO|nr:hypothetical protein [Agromyces ramosus]MDQ0892713.1 hypothetical protein [Agromyces ramosus]
MTEASVPGDRADVVDARASRPATPLWLAVTIAVVFGVFYAYDVWEAVGNLVGLNIYAGQLEVALTAYGVVLLVVGIVVPLLAYAMAFWLGRRRSPLAQVVLFLAGYALVQALSADVAALFDLGGLDL